MDLTQLANLGEFIGGVAVLVTLVYLAIQIRQNTRAVQTASYAQAAEPFYGLLEQISRDGDFAKIVAKALGPPETLTEIEELRFQGWASMVLYAYENLLRAYESGQITEDALLNGIDNAAPLFQGRMIEIAQARPGPTSKRFLAVLEERMKNLGMPERSS